ncbi:MAG: L,D-transpeptidase [Thalassobium sp.]|nr:MAG: L,D-transpeptidase [Thalassobium sp.]
MPFTAPDRRRFLALSGAVALGACTPALTEEEVRAATDLERFGFTPAEGYGLIEDGEYTIPPVPLGYLEYPNRRELVVYDGTEPTGTIEIDPHAKFLYWILDDGTAWRYPIAVGRAGRSLRRPTVIRRKVEWPGWTPTANMLRTQPEVYGPFRSGVPGGLASPLGARALYLYQGGRDTYYRIHGTNDLASIGNSGSAGCIRLFNQDIIDLYERVPNGTNVRIRTKADSERILGPELSNRGVELPPTIVSPETIYGAVEDQTAADTDTGAETDA